MQFLGSLASEHLIRPITFLPNHMIHRKSQNILLGNVGAMKEDILIQGSIWKYFYCVNINFFTGIGYSPSLVPKWALNELFVSFYVIKNFLNDFK